MTRWLIFAAAALAIVTSTPRPAPAMTAGIAHIGAPLRFEIVTILGDWSAGTIVELGSDKVRDVISMTALSGEYATVELTPSRSTRRLIFEVDVPNAGYTRVTVTEQGAPLFPTETLSFSESGGHKRYVFDVREPGQ